MPITLATMPKQLPDAAVAAVRRSIGGMRSPSVATAKADSLHLALQHPVYDLSAADVLAGHGLEKAVQTAWRQLVEHDGAAVATVELPLGGSSGQFTVTNGPFAPGLAAAAERAENLSGVDDAHFKLRILRVPALYAELLWLSPEPDGEDLLLPVAPAPPPLDPGETYSAAEALAALASAADDRDLRTRPKAG